MAGRAEKRHLGQFGRTFTNRGNRDDVVSFKCRGSKLGRQGGMGLSTDVAVQTLPVPLFKKRLAHAGAPFAPQVTLSEQSALVELNVLSLIDL